MKKIYLFSLLMFISLVTNSQNLVVNPTFDNGLTGWSAGPTSSYTLPTLVETEGSDNTNSVNYEATATTGFYQEIAITGGNNLRISFKYKATGDNTDARIWSYYKDATGASVNQNSTTSLDPLRTNNSYLSTATDWTLKTIDVTAPSNVVTLVLAVRAYNNGTASFDEFSVIDLTTLSTSSYNLIEGLKVYPNPAQDIVTISSTADLTKTISIYSLIGQKVLTTTINNSLDISSLTSGIYVLNIEEAGKIVSTKLVVE
jgi:hypothetical protein